MGEKFGGPNKQKIVKLQTEDRILDATETRKALAVMPDIALAKMASTDGLKVSEEQKVINAKINSGEKVLFGEFYIDASTLEEKSKIRQEHAEEKAKETKAQAKIDRAKFEEGQQKVENKKPNKLEQLWNRFFGKKPEAGGVVIDSKEVPRKIEPPVNDGPVIIESKEVPRATPDVYTKKAIVEMPKNMLTLSEIESKQSQINAYTIKAMRDTSPEMKEGRDIAMVKLFQDPTFLQYLQKYVGDLEKNVDNKTDVYKLIQEGREGRVKLMQKIKDLNNGVSVGQSNLAAMFLYNQISYLGESVVKYSRSNQDNVITLSKRIGLGSESFSKSDVNVDFGDQGAIMKYNTTQMYIGKYLKDGQSQDLFKTFRDILGPEQYRKITQNLLKLAIMENIRYDPNTNELEKLEFDQVFAGKVLDLINQKESPKIGTMVPLPNNVVPMFGREVRRNQTNQNNIQAA
jgi:hypothetical protein